MVEPIVNGLDDVAVKAEPEDPLLDAEPPVIPKELLSNGVYEDSDCEDVSFFTQVEVDNTRKCLENTKLIIKDFETQLDWHLQQYMTLRNVFGKDSKNGKDDTSKRQDLLSISQLSAIIANHPEGNKRFIKRKGPISNGAGGRKRRRNKDSESEEEETDFSDEDSDEFDEEDFEMGNDSEDADDPKPKKTRSRRSKADEGPVVKDEIVEEEHELIEPKMERESEDEEMDEDEDEDEEEEEEEEEPEPVPVKKTPAKRGRQAKTEVKKTPAPKKGGRGKKAQNMETVDLTGLKKCSVLLKRVDDGEPIEIKDEDLDKDELVEALKTKAITVLGDFKIDKEKPIAILKEDNAKDFDFNECATSNVVITFEHKDSLPEFIFVKPIVEGILNDRMFLVEATVFDEHLSDDKN